MKKRKIHACIKWKMITVTTSPLCKLSLNTDSKSLFQLQVLEKESKPRYQYVYRCRASKWSADATDPRSVIVPKHCLHNSFAATHARVWLAWLENHSCSEFASATDVSCLEQSISHQSFLVYNSYNFFLPPLPQCSLSLGWVIGKVAPFKVG